MGINFITSGIVSFQWLASIVTICLLVVYLLTNLAAARFAQRQQEWRLIRHGIVPIASSLFLLLPLASFVLPSLPIIGAWVTALGVAPTPFPSNILPLFVLLWGGLGLLIAANLRRRRPKQFERLGTILAEES